MVTVISCTTICSRVARSTELRIRGVHTDVAALTVIVEEAGGSFTDLAGAPVGLATTSVLASNGLLHSPVLETISFGV